jgi:hypothetical protein
MRRQLPARPAGRVDEVTRRSYPARAVEHDEPEPWTNAAAAGQREGTGDLSNCCTGTGM